MWVRVLAALAALAALATLSGLSGCSMFMRSIERPTAEVRDVSLSTAGFAGITGTLALDVHNPNGFGVPLSGIDWELSVGGARAMTGSVELSVTIPARGTAPVTTSLTVSAGDAIAAAASLASGARDYQLSARLHFSTAVGPLAVDLTHRGSLDDAGGVASLLPHR